jgi:hypothetical protein
MLIQSKSNTSLRYCPASRFMEGGSNQTHRLFAFVEKQNSSLLSQNVATTL